MSTETTTPERWTTCSCPDGQHVDPKAATRSHAKQTDAEIIARHTGRVAPSLRDSTGPIHAQSS